MGKQEEELGVSLYLYQLKHYRDGFSLYILHRKMGGLKTVCGVTLAAQPFLHLDRPQDGFPVVNCLRCQRYS
jgi:hypothetical protein